jgi:hypothetical protein
MLKDAQTAVKFFSKFLKGIFRLQTKDLILLTLECVIND